MISPKKLNELFCMYILGETYESNGGALRDYVNDLPAVLKVIDKFAYFKIVSETSKIYSCTVGFKMSDDALVTHTARHDILVYAICMAALKHYGCTNLEMSL